MGALWGVWGWSDVGKLEVSGFYPCQHPLVPLHKDSVMWWQEREERGSLGENGNWKSNSFPQLRGWWWSNQFWWESCRERQTQFLTSLFLPCCAVLIPTGLVTGWIAPQFPSTIRLSISNVFTCLFRGGKTQKMTSRGILSAYLSLSFLIRPRVWQQTSSIQGHFLRY